MKKFTLTLSILLASLSTLYAQVPKVKHWDQKIRAYANNPGWNYITSLNKGEKLTIKINNGAFFEEGRWKSGSESFYAIGTPHTDYRHPYPNKNAMAILFKVGNKDGRTEIQKLCCQFKRTAPDSWKYAPYSITLEGYKKDTPIYWIINDWQKGGLGDNSGYITLYLTFE